MRAAPHSALLATVLCASAWCNDSGRLEGIVQDASGAVVPWTSILCAGEDTGFRFETRTGLDGSFQLTVPAGRYHLIVRRLGFLTVTRLGLIVRPGAVLQVNFELKPSSVWETVTVSDVPAAATLPASGVTVLVPETLGALPTNDSAVTGWLSLAPGVLFTPASRGEAGQFSSLGARPNTNAFSVDGVSGNNAVAGAGWPSLLSGGRLPAMTALGTTHNLAMRESIQDVTVETQGETEGAGQAPGAAIIIHTRSGADVFHGSLYGGARPTVLGANDWFANRYALGHTAPALNEQGGAFGGPLRHNRTFAFAAADRLAVSQGYGWTTSVPSRIARALSPQDLRALLREFPLPNGPDFPGLGISQLSGHSRQPGTVIASSLRVDHRYAPAGRLFLRAAFTPSRNAMGVTQTNLTEYRNRMAVVGNTWNVARWIHTSRVSYSRNLVTSTWSVADGAETPGLPFYSQYPSLAADFTNVVVGGAGSVSVGQNGRNRQTQWQASHTSVFEAARHLVRFGFEYLDLIPERQGPASSVTVAFGTPRDQYAGPLAPVWITYSHPEAESTRLTRLGAFAQDNWRLTSRLNLTFALRASWPRSPRVTPAAGLFLVNDPLATSMTPVRQSQPLWRGNPIQLAPSVALAWRLSQTGSTVLRASWGTFHDVESTAATDQLNGIPYQQLQTPQGGGILSYSASSLQLVGLGYGFSRDLHLPTYYRASAQLQHQWRKDSVAVSYAGLRGSSELRRQLVFGPTGARDIGALIFAASNGNSQYHGLNALYRRTLASGIQANLVYSWSHSIDLGSSDSSVYFTSPLHSPSLDRGSSDYDVRHFFNAALTYSTPALPGTGIAGRLISGWTFGLLATARTGFPINVELSETDDGFAIANFQAGIVPGAPIWVSSRYAFPSAPGERILNPPPPLDNGGVPRAFGYPVAGIRALGRNSISGFGAWQADMSAQRTLWQRDRFLASLRVSAYNALNHAMFADPTHFWSNPMFGQSQSPLNLMLGGGSPSSGQSPAFLMGAPRSFEATLRIAF